MVIFETVPHVPIAGVKVYTVLPTLVVLIEDGLQVPLIPSFDIAGSAGVVSCWQYEPDMVGKVGETLLAIVMFKEVGVEQVAAEDGVKW
jgi:hypothetical protein